MSKLVAAAYEGSTGLGSSIFIKVIDPSTGSTIVSRSNGGIREDAAGCYIWSGLIADLDAYEVIWDEGSAPFSVEVIIPEPDITITDSGGGALPVTGDANGTLAGLTFLIKRGDTRPYLRRQLVDTDGNAITMDGTETVKFTMRSSTDVAMGSGAKTHASAVIVDSASAIVEYRWVAADTNTTTYTETSTLGGHTDVPYAGEFEVTFTGGDIETFPQGTYIAISMPPDLDPGIDP